MVSSDEDKFDQYLDPTLEYLERLEEQGIHKAEAYGASIFHLWIYNGILLLEGYVIMDLKVQVQ